MEVKYAFSNAMHVTCALNAERFLIYTALRFDYFFLVFFFFSLQKENKQQAPRV